MEMVKNKELTAFKQCRTGSAAAAPVDLFRASVVDGLP